MWSSSSYLIWIPHNLVVCNTGLGSRMSGPHILGTLPVSLILQAIFLAIITPCSILPPLSLTLVSSWMVDPGQETHWKLCSGDPPSQCLWDLGCRTLLHNIYFRTISDFFFIVRRSPNTYLINFWSLEYVRQLNLLPVEREPLNK